MSRFVTPILLSVALYGPALAQVTAQHEPRSPYYTELECPMVLTLPLEGEYQLAPKKVVRYGKETRKWLCEDTRINTLDLEMRRPVKGKATIEIHGTLIVRESFDRLATLRFSFMKGEEPVATVGVFNIDAEEGKIKEFRAEIVVPAEATQPEAAPALKVTLDVRDND